METGFTEGSQSGNAVTYELALSPGEAGSGVTRILTRNAKRLEAKVPPGTRDGQVIRLRNGLKITDGRDGDILIRVHVSAPAGAVTAVTDATFESEVLKSPLPVLVDFWAAWCGPCRMVGPVVEKLAEAYAGRVRFCKLNVDENPLASRKYQVMSIPTILIFKRGRIAGMSVGAVSEEELRGRVETALSAP